MAKRTAGGQKGNKNAWIHGFYSSPLNPSGRKLLREAAQMDPKRLEPEIALLRSRMHVLANADKANIELLTMALRTLTRLVGAQFHLNDTQQQQMHDSLHDLVRSLIPNPASS